MQRQPREKNEKHLDFIRSLPCISCGNPIETQAAHIRFGDVLFGKRATGMAEKPDDKWTMPLCGKDHQRQHEMNERHFWELEGIDALRVALELFDVTGNFERGCEIVARVRA